MPPTLDGQSEIATPWTNTALLMGQSTAYELTQISGLGVTGVRPNDIDLLIGGVYAARDIANPRTLEYDIEVVPSGSGSARDTDLATKLSDLLVAWSPWPGNLLSAHQASLEDSTLGTTGWVAFNSTLARTTAQAASGLASLQVTATGSSTAGGQISTGLNAAHIINAQSYTGLASFRAASTARPCEVALRWFDGAGQLISEDYSAAVTNTTTGWTQVTVTATAPLTARFAGLLAYAKGSPANNEVHYIDKASIAPGSSTTWRAPGDVDVDLTFKVIGRANNRKVTGRPRVAEWSWDVAMDSSRIAVVTAEFFVPRPEIRDVVSGDVVRY